MIPPHNQCEWLDWFDRLHTDEIIRVAAYVPGSPVRDLANLSIDEACQKLDYAWKAIFVPGPQHVKILRSLLDQARGFAKLTYPTLKDYNRLRYYGIQGLCTPQPIRCLTGLAGVSKSSLVRAFERICQLQYGAEFSAEGQRLQIYPVRRLELDGQPAIRGVLRSIANPFALTGRAMNETAGLMEHVSDWLQATATSTLVVDEMQFFTQSSSASTKTSQLIMTLANLGPPLVYVANYSLVKKLMLRPQEEKDRLLAAPILLNPPEADDPHWVATIKEYLAVAPDTITLDANVHAEVLHQYSAGLFRALRQLLLQVYREARERGKHIVTLEDIKFAYCSRAYSSHRRDVEDLKSLAFSSPMSEKRPDLVCPFGEIKRTEPRKLVQPRSPLQAQRIPSDAPTTMLESTLSVEARVTLRDLRRAATRPPEERTTATVTRLVKATPVSAHTLRQGTQILRDVLKRPASSTKSPSASPEADDVKTK